MGEGLRKKGEMMSQNGWIPVWALSLACERT